jgi:hypothetical protein
MPVLVPVMSTDAMTCPLLRLWNESGSIPSLPSCDDLMFEIWCFVGAKAKNVSLEKKAEGWGDTWTWTGLDADTKLCVSYLVGDGAQIGQLIL